MDDKGLILSVTCNAGCYVCRPMVVIVLLCVPGTAWPPLLTTTSPLCASSLKRMFVHFVQVNVYTRTHAHVSCMHTYTRTHTRIRTHTCMHTYMYTHVRAHTHTQHTYTRAHTHTHAHTHIPAHTHAHACLHVCRHAHIVLLVSELIRWQICYHLYGVTFQVTMASAQTSLVSSTPHSPTGYWSTTALSCAAYNLPPYCQLWQMRLANPHYYLSIVKLVNQDTWK